MTSKRFQGSTTLPYLAVIPLIILGVLSILATGGGGGGGSNNPPVADAGPDQTSDVLVSDVVILDGSASNDPDGHALTYSWSLMVVPAGSTAELSDPTVVNPDFVADKPGMYTAWLTVNDGFIDSAPDDVAITVVVPPPVVSITAPENLSVVTASPVTVTGTVDDLTATIAVNGTDVANNNGSYSSPVMLQPGSNNITVIAQNGTGEGSASVEVIFNDGLAPAMTITLPKRFLPKNSTPKTAFLVGGVFEIGETFQPTPVAVAGVIKVNTTAFLPANNRPSVTVNGIAANVSLDLFFSGCGLLNPFQCWKFTATITLEKGVRIITAVGTDIQNRVSTASIGGTVDYCRKAEHDEDHINFGVDPKDPGVLALRGNNQGNRCHEIDGCSLPRVSKSLANNPMPLAIFNAAPIRFGAGTDPPSEHFIHDLDSSVYPKGCNIHDACYQTCVPDAQQEAAWRACNRRQYQDHTDVCRKAYPSNATCPFVIGCAAWRTTWLAERSTCFGLATTYFAGVSTGFVIDKLLAVPNTGWGAYLKRQEEYCAS